MIDLSQSRTGETSALLTFLITVQLIQNVTHRPIFCSFYINLMVLFVFGQVQTFKSSNELTFFCWNGVLCKIIFIWTKYFEKEAWLSLSPKQSKPQC